jgi:hypothetical protein
MQMHIDQRELKPTIDALEFALNQIYHDIANGSLHDGPIAKQTIEQLQMLRLALMLGAAKEQREGRANPPSDSQVLALCIAQDLDENRDLL